VVGQKDGKVTLAPCTDMMNNQFHPTQSANYTRCLAQYKLPSDAWSREAAKASRIDGRHLEQLFELGPIGAHLRWLWMRQEFKYYWDPLHWPFAPRLNIDWYLNTRLGLESGSSMFEQMKRSKMIFKDVAPMIKVITYDCCAAVGALGDDFMRRLGIMATELPDYNSGVLHPHRVFGKDAKDLGGINGARLAAVMRTFLHGSLMVTAQDARRLIDPASIRHVHQQSPYQLRVFLENMLPLMKRIADLRADMARFKKELEAPKNPEHARQLKVQLENAHQEILAKEEALRNVPGVDRTKPLPTRADIPYEQLYEQATNETGIN
jgi:hypothetical protein